MRTSWALVTAFLLTVAGGTLNAQDAEEGNSSKDRPPQDRRRGTAPAFLNIEELKTDLELNDEQANKLKPILEKVKKIFESVKPQAKPGSRKHRDNRENMRREMEKIRPQIMIAIEPAKEFLNAEQYRALKDKLTRPPRRTRHCDFED
ncbi:MAG: hypothetical protein PHV59_06150 [Victivallales bacterium]|nr:hypothetical protein [Victivallales bacterium]